MSAKVRRCLAVVNQFAGRGNARQLYDRTVRRVFDSSGVFHYGVDLADSSATLHALRDYLPRADALVVCGGDGTINYVAKLLLGLGNEEVMKKPIFVVPCGRNNSLACSLGIDSVERVLSCLNDGDVRCVPVWQVRGPGLDSRYMLSHVALGTLASVAERCAKYEEMKKEYFSIPYFIPTLGLASMASVIRQDTIPCSAKIYSSQPVPKASSTPAPSHVFAGPLRMIVASQVSEQLPRFSLTPDVASLHEGCAVAIATGEVSRLRMWHLLRREARQQCVLNEDGVTLLRNVVRIELQHCKSLTHNIPDCREDGDGGERENVSPCSLLLDSDVVPCRTFDELVMERTVHSLRFFAPC